MTKIYKRFHLLDKPTRPSSAKIEVEVETKLLQIEMVIEIIVKLSMVNK